MAEEASFGAFLHAFTARWLCAMSSGLGVPLSVGAFFVEPTIARVGLAVTAVACFFFAAFGIWKIQWERTKRVQRELGNAAGQLDESEQKRRLLDGLGTLLHLGNQLTFISADERESPAPKSEYDEWAKMTIEFEARRVRLAVRPALYTAVVAAVAAPRCRPLAPRVRLAAQRHHSRRKTVAWRHPSAIPLG
jgi:hypothetical protein